MREPRRYAPTQHTVGYVEKDNATTTHSPLTTSPQETQVHRYYQHTAHVTHDAATAHIDKNQKIR